MPHDSEGPIRIIGQRTLTRESTARLALREILRWLARTGGAASARYPVCGCAGVHHKTAQGSMITKQSASTAGIGRKITWVHIAGVHSVTLAPTT